MAGHLRRQLAALHDEDGPVVTRGLCKVSADVVVGDALGRLLGRVDAPPLPVQLAQAQPVRVPVDDEGEGEVRMRVRERVS